MAGPARWGVSPSIQLARMQGAHLIATVSASNRDFVTTLGADEAIDYSTTPFETCVRDIDVVLDTVGGETRDRSWNVLRPGGGPKVSVLAIAGRTRTTGVAAAIAWYSSDIPTAWPGSAPAVAESRNVMMEGR